MFNEKMLKRSLFSREHLSQRVRTHDAFKRRDAVIHLTYVVHIVTVPVEIFG